MKQATLDEHLLENGFARPISSSNSCSVFCPPSNASGNSSRRHARALYRELARNERIAFLACAPGDLSLAPSVGPSTFFSPRFPEMCLRLLSSASRVVSYRLSVAEWCAKNGIPALFVGDSPEELESARAAGAAAFALSCPPRAILGEAKSVGGNRMLPTRTEAAEPLDVCLVADSGYLHHLAGAIENLHDIEGGAVRFHVLALDEGVASWLPARFPGVCLRVHRLEDLWTEPERAAVLKLPLRLRAFVSKSRLLRAAIRSGAGRAFYVDCDLFFFEPLSSLLPALDNGTVLLFPHWNDDVHELHRHGIFNAGMIGVRSDAELFLNWWTERCLNDGMGSSAGGYFEDQGYLDLAPLYFDVVIHRERRHNVGPWCLQSLAGTDRLGSFHATHPDGTGWFEAKACWDQLTALFSPPLPDGGRELFRSTVQQQAPHWPALSRAFYLAHYLPYRLHLPSFRLDRGPASLLTSAAGLRVLGLRARDGQTRFFQGSWRETPWIRWQRAFFGDVTP